MEQPADGSPQGGRVSPPDFPPRSDPPTAPHSGWGPPPSPRWGTPPGASAGPVAWGPPPGPPPGWTPPPPGAPPPGGWSLPPGPPRQPRYSVGGIIFVAVLGLFLLVGLLGGGAEDESPPGTSAGETSGPAQLPTTDPPAQEPGFGDGTFMVGADIAPGLYRVDGTGGCYWKRLSDLQGDLDAILANDGPEGQAYVEILATDAAFATEDCGRWLPATGDGPDVSSGFGDGTYLVGSEIQPGTYRSTGSSGCYWKRLSNLQGDLDAILANDDPEGQAYVEILPTDVAFSTDDCGTWSRIG
jgi:hypothetical protein